MANIRLQNVIGNIDVVESYMLFRTIEDWCHDNVADGNWQFDYTYTICAYGVDIAGGIIFRHEEDTKAFKLKFGL